MPDLLEQFEDDSPPTDMRPFQEWDSLLEEGETVLWKGFEVPYKPTTIWEKLHQIKSYMIILAGVSIGLWLSPIGWLVTAFGALEWFVSSPLNPKNQTIFAYAISDRHAFIHERNARDRRMRIAHARIDKIIVVEGPPDQVYFGQKHNSSGERFGGVVSSLTSTANLDDTSKTLIGFYNIMDGNEAAKLLSQAKENAS